jgi:hypothetical protein
MRCFTTATAAAASRSNLVEDTADALLFVLFEQLCFIFITVVILGVTASLIDGSLVPGFHWVQHNAATLGAIGAALGLIGLEGVASD